MTAGSSAHRWLPADSNVIQDSDARCNLAITLMQVFRAAAHMALLGEPKRYPWANLNSTWGSNRSATLRAEIKEGHPIMDDNFVQFVAARDIEPFECELLMDYPLKYEETGTTMQPRATDTTRQPPEQLDEQPLKKQCTEQLNEPPLKRQRTDADGEAQGTNAAAGEGQADKAATVVGKGEEHEAAPLQEVVKNANTADCSVSVAGLPAQGKGIEETTDPPAQGKEIEANAAQGTSKPPAVQAAAASRDTPETLAPAGSKQEGAAPVTDQGAGGGGSSDRRLSVLERPKSEVHWKSQGGKKVVVMNFEQPQARLAKGTLLFSVMNGKTLASVPWRMMPFVTTEKTIIYHENQVKKLGDILEHCPRVYGHEVDNLKRRVTAEINGSEPVHYFYMPPAEYLDVAEYFLKANGVQYHFNMKVRDINGEPTLSPTGVTWVLSKPWEVGSKDAKVKTAVLPLAEEPSNTPA